MRDFTNQSNIESIEFCEEEIEMMDLGVEDVHCLYVNGIVAHNCAEEVRVLAILSNEHVLIDPILNGEDIHKFVATKMFGHYDPAHRTIAKTITFAANYGGSGYTIAKRLGISQQEGEELLDRYNKTLVNATRWKEEMMKEARRKGIVFTYFGRPRCVWQYYNSSDKSKHGFADRTAINSPIQGFGGDLIRIDHIKLWQKFLDDKEFADNVKYACTVHDEINLFVKPHYLKKAMDTLNSIMNFQPSAFPIPISITPSVGFGWGDQIEASVNDNNQISIPEYDNIPVEELVAKFKVENPDLYV